MKHHPTCSLVPRPSAFVACSTKFAQRVIILREFRNASDKRAGPGNEATLHVLSKHSFMCPHLLLGNLLIITKDVCVQSHDGNLPSERLAGDLSIVQHQWAMAKWELCDTSHLTHRPLRKKYTCKCNMYVYM